MKRAFARALLLLGAAASGCGRTGLPGKTAAARPAGNGIWFANGFAGEREESEALSAISRGGFSWVLLPAVRMEKKGALWTAARLPLPPVPVTGIVVSAIIEAGEDAAAALVSRDKAERRLFEDGLALAIKTASSEPRIGKVTGVHLDLPVVAETAPGFPDALRRIRRRLPAGLFVSMTLTGPPPAADGQERLQELAGAVDGFVAMVFGEDVQADPLAVDELGRRWWAGYSPNAEGRWKSRDGRERGTLPEGFLKGLSDDPRLEFQHDMEVEERVGFAYFFRVRRPITVQGVSFAAGDEVFFRQPSLPDMIRRLGKDTAGRRYAAGRVFRVAGASDSERIFTLPALNEIQLGRSLVPALHVSVERGDGTVTLSVANASVLPSALSRTSNWIEVDLTRPGIRDVRYGGFDRYEVFTATGQRVSLGRSSRIRFYETLIGPSEKIEPAVILVRSPVPTDCCRFRYHLIAASGPEVATEWQRAGNR
jgi:hypothetical protein